MVENKITKVTTVLKSYYFRYMSIVPILNMLGSMGAYPMGEWLGRKKVVILFFNSNQCSMSMRLQVLILSTLLNILGFVIIYFR